MAKVNKSIMIEEDLIPKIEEYRKELEIEQSRNVSLNSTISIVLRRFLLERNKKNGK